MQKGAKFPFSGNIVGVLLSELLKASIGIEPVSRATILYLQYALTTTTRRQCTSLRNYVSCNQTRQTHCGILYFRIFHRNFHFTWKKKSDSSRPKNYKALKPCWLLNWVSIARVVACFPQATSSLPTATAADSETPCVCARPSDPRKQSRRAAPRAWQLILPSKPLIAFWNSLWRDCQMTGRGSKLDSWTLPPDQRV